MVNIQITHNQTRFYDRFELPPPNNILDLHHEEEEEEEEEEEAVVTVTSFTPRNVIIDLNEDYEEIGYRTLDIDLNELINDNERGSSDSSGNERMDQQTRYDSSTRTTPRTTIPQNGQGTSSAKKKRELTDDERWAVYHVLLARSVHGKVKKKTTNQVKDMFGFDIQNVQRIWRIHKKTPVGNRVNVSSKKKGNVGRKRIQIDLERIRELPLHKRTTLTSLAEHLGCSCSKLHSLLRQGVLRRHSNAIKPHLKEENKTSRMAFCLSMLEESTLLNDPKFKGMYNYVHIDEKWFYLTNKESNVLHPTR